MSVSSASIEVERRSEIKPYQTMRGHTREVRGVAHLPDGQHIITCSLNASLRLWDRESGAQIGSNWQDDRDGASVFTMALSPNGKTVASGSEDGTVKLWNIEMRKVIASWTGHNAIVWSVRWSADGTHVASGSYDGTVRVWEMESGKTVLGPIKTGNQWVNAVAYSPDSSNIASGGDKAIEIWDTTTGERLSTPEQDSHVRCLGWTSDQKKLIAGFQFGSIGIFNTTTWEQIAILEGHRYGVNSISLLQNDRLLASVSGDGTARLWNLDTNLPVGPPLQHQSWVRDAAFSADGKYLVTGCGDNNVYVWNTHTILKEAGLNDLLSLSNVAHVKSILNADATRCPSKLKVTHTAAPRGFFDDVQDGAPSSTTRTNAPPAMAHIDPPNIDPASSTTHIVPRSSPPPRRHALALVSGARALFARILPRFLQSQPNTDQSTDPRQNSDQTVVSIHAPSQVQVAAVHPDAPESLAQLEELPPSTQAQGIVDRPRDHIHSSTTCTHPPSSESHRHYAIPLSSRSSSRLLLGRISQHFRGSHPNTNQSTELQEYPTRRVISHPAPAIVEAPEGRDNNPVYVAPPTPPPAIGPHMRLKYNTWWARGIFHICCHPVPQSDDNEDGNSISARPAVDEPPPVQTK